MKKLMFRLTGMKTHTITLLLLDASINLIFLIFIFPLLHYAFDYILRLWGQSYITGKNIISFLTFPPAILFLILFIIIFTVFILWKITTIIHYCHCITLGIHPNALKTIAVGFFKMSRLLFTGNVTLPFIALLIYIFTNIPLLIGFFLKVDLPVDTPKGSYNMIFLRILIILFLCFFTFLGFRSLFTLHFCVNEKTRHITSLEQSKKLLKGRSLRTATKLLLYNTFLTLILYLIYNIILLIMALLIYIVSDKEIVVTVFLSYYPKINSYSIILFSMIYFATNLNLISTLYIKFNKEEGKVYPPDITIRNEEEYNLLPQKGHGKVTLVILIILIASGLINFYISIRNDTFYLKDALLGIQITSHRGNSTKAPENTLPALECAIKAYADYAEIDVQQTKDGVLVLMHDKSLQRTTNSNKYIWQLNYEDIKQLDAGYWFSEEYKGTSIPTLEEALVLSKGRINLHIEVKLHGHERDIVEKLANLIEEYDYEHQCIISSTDYNTLVNIKQVNKNLRTGYILSAAYGNFFDKEYVDFLSIRSNFITKSVVESAHIAGKEVHAWTINSSRDIERMKSLGVDAIITDNPYLAREVLFVNEANDTFVELLNKMLKNHSFYQIVNK